MKKSTADLRVWVVSESSAGTLNQALGVAERLTETPIVKVVAKERRWKQWLMPFRQEKTEAAPDVIISCGMVAERFVCAMKSAFEGRPLAVHLQHPGKNDCFDVVFVSGHDWLPAFDQSPRIHRMLGVPNRLREDDLLGRRAAARATWAKADERVAALLVGGPNQAFSFAEGTGHRLKEVVEAALAKGWVVLATVSRRSPQSVTESLSHLSHPRFVMWDAQGDNPYRDYLAAADALIVTQDSISMASDAIVSGKPLHILPLRVVDEIKAQKFSRFHAELYSRGFAREFSGTIEGETYKAPDETGRIAAIVGEMVASRSQRET